MKKMARYGLILSVMGMVASGPVSARPPWAGGGGHGEKGKGPSFDLDYGGKHDRGHTSRRADKQFNDQDRSVIREYFASEFRGGHCPPGLAKKHNGCMPPGQAKQWRLGYRLPTDVVIYDLPAALVVKIGMPPVGYKYVRVASDILMIAAGTGMVVSAIQDLGGL